MGKVPCHNEDTYLSELKPLVQKIVNSLFLYFYWNKVFLTIYPPGARWQSVLWIRRVPSADNLFIFFLFKNSADNNLLVMLALPKISTGKIFYLRQVWLYNLGIHLISTERQNGKGYYHIWTEDQGSREPKEVGSSLLVFPEISSMKKTLFTFYHPVAYLFDSRPEWLFCLWYHLLGFGVFKEIDFKFPEVGHTFMIDILLL